MNKNVIGTCSGIAAAGIWGGMYVVSKVVLDVIPPFSLITLRLILGCLTLWILVLARSNMNVSGDQFRRVFIVGMIGYGISLSFQFIGTKLSTAANASLVTSATPAFILLFAWMILHEHITGLRVTALIVSTVGVIAVINPSTVHVDPSLFWGNICLLAAALTWAIYSVFIRVVTRQMNVLIVSLIAFLGGFPITVPVGIWEVSTQRIGHIGPGIITGILFLGVIATALAMLLWNTAFATLDASVASLTFFAQPVVGALLGWFFLKENITPLFILGGILIGIGLIIASRSAEAPNIPPK